MKVYLSYYSYGKENFAENVKFSCHSWLLKCIDDISNAELYVQQNKYFMHNKDLVGKYNALNFLLEVFTYHQTSKFSDYPKDRNYNLDFCIILNSLIRNNANIYSTDYERKTFLENFNAVFNSQEKLSWKQKYKFLSKESFDILNSKIAEKTLKEMLKNEQRPIYLGLCLEHNLDNKNQVNKKIKL